MSATDEGLSTADLSGSRTEADAEPDTGSDAQGGTGNKAQMGTGSNAQAGAEGATTDASLVDQPETGAAQGDQTDPRTGAEADTAEAGKDRADETAGDTTDETTDETTEPLLSGDDSTAFQKRWLEIQVRFVDEPQGAVKEADGLVAEVMQRLATTFADERGRLEGEWERGDEVSTEDLRQALRHYRSFFERLLST
jgi:hypothetical protein